MTRTKALTTDSMLRPMGRRGLPAARLALLLATLGAAALGAPRALLIGLNYKGSPHDVSPLPGIELDMSRMRQVAQDFGIDDIRELWNSKATLGGIRNAILHLGEGASPNDLLLVYYSGHGTRVPDRGGMDEADGMDEALVPFDARPIMSDDSPEPVDLENALVDDEFGQLLGGIGSDRMLVLVDACHSGTVARSLGGQTVSKAYVYSAKAARPPARSGGRSRGLELMRQGETARLVGIMASRDEEKANATPRGSVLTNALHEAVSVAIEEGAANVTVEELFGQTELHVASQMKRLRVAAPHLSQNPSLFVSAGSEDLRGLELPLRSKVAESPRLDPPEDDPLINRWSRVADRALQNIAMTVPRETFRMHPAYTGTPEDCGAAYSDHLLSIRLVAPRDGYLNVVNAGQGETEPVVLYPNRLSRQDNRVRAGQEIVIPAPGGNWCLPAASVPTGMDSQWVLVVAAFSDEEVNFYRDGKGKGQFKTLSRKSARSFGVAGGGRPAAAAEDVPTITAAAAAHLLIERQ